MPPQISVLMVGFRASAWPEPGQAAVGAAAVAQNFCTDGRAPGCSLGEASAQQQWGQWQWSCTPLRCHHLCIGCELLHFFIISEANNNINHRQG